ncbi:MAG: hypothetical protein HYR91_11570 [Flavobacteriia bacterium]|nr:hypothetical protein [Flavobacteriia bacterium]
MKVLNGGKSANPKSCKRLYRFGYNGMEKDPEIKGEGNSYTTEFRQYDPRLGRWLSCDPKRHWFPSMSAYCFASNSPIAGKDDNGLYTIFVNGYIYGGPNYITPGGNIHIDDIVPGRPYWLKKCYFKGDNEEEFIDAAHSYFGDGIGKYVNGTGSWMGSTASGRQKLGREQAEEIAQEVIAEILKLNNDCNPDGTLNTSNDVTELNFATHSMGAAYAEGLIEVFMEHKVLSDLMKKGEIVHLSACDADKIVISENSKCLQRTQINIRGDRTLFYADNNSTTDGYQIPGIKRFIIINPSEYIMHPNYDAKKNGYYDYHNDTKSTKWPWLFLEQYNKGIKSNPSLNGKGVIMGTEDLQYEDTLPAGNEQSNTSNKG